MALLQAGVRPTVWILGAGFSKGLGGPLIEDLLAHRERGLLDTLFPDELYSGVAEEVFKARVFYNWGQERGYWDDAEQFLDLVESAAAETGVLHSYAHLLLTSMLRGTVRHPETGEHTATAAVSRPQPLFQEFETLPHLASACRRALAVDCTVFLRAAQLDSERWSPYKEWALGLGPSDTVITFNYDHVPELLAMPHSQLRIIDPERVVDDLEDAAKLGAVPVLKVHGSVTWRLDGDRIAMVPLDLHKLIDAKMDSVLGVPGPGKRTLVRDRLKALWAAALEAVRRAGRVIFVGYRFPPTDADSRAGLLGALAQNKYGDKGPNIQTVLGPNVTGPDSIRLARLLDASTAATVTAVPLFAEDFIGLRKTLRL